MSVGSRIKEKREELRITQQELADKINCTKAAISNYEKNVSIPKPEFLIKLMEVLSVDANYLFQDEFNNEMEEDVAHNSEEIKLLINYRKLDTISKEIVNKIIEMELKRHI